jgi:hypothetical protein
MFVPQRQSRVLRANVGFLTLTFNAIGLWADFISKARFKKQKRRAKPGVSPISRSQSLFLLQHHFRRLNHRRHRISHLQLHLIRAALRDHALHQILAHFHGHVRHHATIFNLHDLSLKPVPRRKCHAARIVVPPTCVHAFPKQPPSCPFRLKIAPAPFYSRPSSNSVLRSSPCPTQPCCPPRNNSFRN